MTKLECFDDLPVLLLIEDEPNTRALAENCLSETFHVVSAINGDSALRHLGNVSPDLVVCEFSLTTAYGSRVIESVRQRLNLLHTPILALVEPFGDDVPLGLEDEQVQDYLVKPFRTLELKIRCKKLLALKRSREILATREQERSAQLLQSENRFRLMVESVADYAMFMVDLDGAITSWNKGAERLTGYAEHEAIGRHFSMLYPSEDLDEGHARYELAMAKRHGRHEEEGVRVCKDGSTYYAQILVWPVEDKKGEIVGFVKITRDITSRRQAEQALKESEAKFRTITDAMPQIVWSTLPNGQYDYFNEQWYRYTGASEGATDGESWNRMLHPEDRARAMRAWQHALETGNTYEVQYRLRHYSGAYRWTLGRALPVKDDMGNIVRWMGTLTDIHEQKQAEEALKDAARRKDEFLAMLAHELRNPLAPVRNSTSLLQKLVPEDERVQQALNVIERQVRHMACLIDDLLDVARISRGKIEIRKEAMDLVEVIRHTVEDFEVDYQKKKIALQLDVAAEALWLQGDRTRIAQVLANLLHNALKFTESGGCVAVKVRKEDVGENGIAIIEVTDSGVGIEPNITVQLFNPFIQAKQGLARSKGGLGLGLALVRGLVDMHGGTVAAHSEGVGQGATFILRFPLIQIQQPEAISTDANTQQQALAVLLIDDNQDMLDSLSTLLSLEGHNVTTALDGAIGVKTVKEIQPDLVLCDIGLPGELDGYGVARSIRADPEINKVFLVALSGYGQEKDRQRARDSGFDYHLLKPLEFPELTKVLSIASVRKVAATSVLH